MTIHDTFAGAQYVTNILNIVNDMGVMIEIGSDFDLYADYIQTQRSHLPLGLPFDPAHNQLDGDDGFWIVGWDQAGALMHSQAMRLVDLGGAALADYLRDNFDAFAPPGVQLDKSRSSYLSGPGARQISGRTCYHGDLWVQSGQPYRGSGLPGVLARFALATAVLRWRPDHIFGFMAEHHAFRGLAEREGYMHTDPGALSLFAEGGNDAIRGFLTYMGRDDLSHLIKLPPNEYMATQRA